ncbi:hypothetical protein Tco_1404803 [Tanacetum coccineum]
MIDLSKMKHSLIQDWNEWKRNQYMVCVFLISLVWGSVQHWTVVPKVIWTSALETLPWFVICNSSRAMSGEMAHLVTLPAHWIVLGMVIVALGTLKMRPDILPLNLPLLWGSYGKVPPCSMSLILITSTSIP